MRKKSVQRQQNSVISKDVFPLFTTPQKNVRTNILHHEGKLTLILFVRDIATADWTGHEQVKFGIRTMCEISKTNLETI